MASVKLSQLPRADASASSDKFVAAAAGANHLIERASLAVSISRNVGTLRAFPVSHKALPENLIELGASVQIVPEASAQKLADVLGTQALPALSSFKQGTATHLYSPTATASEEFGVAALSADGSTLAVSARYARSSLGRSGAVFIYGKVEGAWTRLSTIEPAYRDSEAGFGTALSLSADGSTLAVGRPTENTYVAEDAGSVQMYKRTDGVWALTASLRQTDIQVENGRSTNYFGSAVEVSRDGMTMAASAPAYKHSMAGNNVGRVSVFSFASGEWVKVADLLSPSPKAQDNLGYVIAMSADAKIIAVSALYSADALAYVVVFRYVNGAWAAGTIIRAPDQAEYDGFGTSLALSPDGNTLAVGANADDNAAGTNAGSVYLYGFSDGAWRFTARMQSPDSAGNDFFGSTVRFASEGNTLAVGATNDSNENGASAGSIYLFSAENGSWVLSERISSPDKLANEGFGIFDLSADGTTMVVMESTRSTAAGPNAGKAIVIDSLTRAAGNYIQVPAAPSINAKWGIQV